MYTCQTRPRHVSKSHCTSQGKCCFIDFWQFITKKEEIEANPPTQNIPKPNASPNKSNSVVGHADTTTLLPRIPKIQIGAYEIDTWFAAPYPEEFTRIPKLYLCEYCLKYSKSDFSMNRHFLKCPLRRPPGDEVYRDGKISIFEVDGRKNKVFFLVCVIVIWWCVYRFIVRICVFWPRRFLITRLCTMMLNPFCFTSWLNVMRLDVIWLDTFQRYSGLECLVIAEKLGKTIS